MAASLTAARHFGSHSERSEELLSYDACKGSARTLPTENKETGRQAAPCLVSYALLLRLRDGSQIGLVRLEPLRILLLRVLVGNRSGNDDVLARLPVHRCGYGVLRVQLNRVEQAQHFVEIAAAAHRIRQRR